MRLDFTPYELLRRFLPHHKRKANRLNLFNWVFLEITSLWSSFLTWRNEILYEINITGQRLSLMDFLNRRISGSNNSISIIEQTDAGTYLGLSAENLDKWEISTIDENSDYIELSIISEGGEALTTDFQVLIPSTANADEVAKIVDRYVIAGLEYEIIQS